MIPGENARVEKRRKNRADTLIAKQHEALVHKHEASRAGQAVCERMEKK